MTDPLFLLGPSNMSDPCYLGLAIIHNPLFWQWAAQFSRKREGREGGREKPPSWSSSSAHAPCHCAWGGKAHRKMPHKAALRSVLGPQVPPKWHERRLPAGACPAHLSHFLIYIIILYFNCFKENKKDREVINCMLSKFF
jgi:hypothetical protein